MEIFNLIICALAVLLAGVCLFFACQFAFDSVSRGILSKRALAFGSESKVFVRGGKSESKNSNFIIAWFFWLLRNGVTPIKKSCSWVLKRFKPIDKLFTDFVYLLECKNITSDKKSAMSAFIFLVVVLALLVSLLFASLIAGIAVVLLAVVIFVTSLRSFIDKRNEEIRDAVPDALRCMGSCFQSGYTLLQTFEFLSNECCGEIAKLFDSCSNILRTGGTIPSALDKLKSKKSAPELAFVAVALDVQHQSGGSMGPVIDAARDMVESRLDLLQKLKVQTAQAKLSAKVVTILPFALIACFSIISPNFLAPFFSSFLGIVVLCIAAIMQLAGIICVRRMLDVEV